jgi:hypothetical protein
MAESGTAAAPTEQWDALPQRKRRGNRGDKEETKRSREHSDEVAAMPQIDAALQDRAQQRRIQGSLTDKDGVASEFYECAYACSGACFGLCELLMKKHVMLLVWHSSRFGPHSRCAAACM